MQCPLCRAESKVVDSRPARLSIRRRRACLSCDHRWSTFEVMDAPDIYPYPICKKPGCTNSRRVRPSKAHSDWGLCELHHREKESSRRSTEAYRSKRRQSLKLKRLKDSK